MIVIIIIYIDFLLPTRIILEDGSRTDNRLGAASIHLPPHTPGPEQHWHQVGYPYLSAWLHALC